MGGSIFCGPFYDPNNYSLQLTNGDIMGNSFLKVKFFFIQECTPSVIGGKRVQGNPVFRSRPSIQSEGEVPGGID